MTSNLTKRLATCMSMVVALGALAGCRNHTPHAFQWPSGGDIIPTHGKPPEGAYYSNWDPFAVELQVTPLKDINPVMTQHIMVATVLDKKGKALPNRRVEWIISEGSVGDIVEVDESGWRASRGYKVDNHYAISHTNNFSHVLDRGNDDPSDDVSLEKGQTWCVITSPIEGETNITVYCPGIYNWDKHKVFAKKYWYDVDVIFPSDATNPCDQPHTFTTQVVKHSDGSGLADYEVTYQIVGGNATFDNGSTSVAGRTDASGMASATIRPAPGYLGSADVEIHVRRPADIQCCKPAVDIGDTVVTKSWFGSQLAITKSGPSGIVVAGQEFDYTINVQNIGQGDASNVMVTDQLPAGVDFISSSPSGNGSWSLGSIAAGGSATVTIRARVNAGTNAKTIDNCATASAACADPVSDCHPITIGRPGLALRKECMQVGCDQIRYNLVVTNTGDAPANNVQVNDNLPSGLTADSGGNTKTFDAGNLAPGESKQASYMANASGGGTFTNRATASADGGLSASAECTTTIATPSLTISKSARPTTLFMQRGRDQQVEYTITVSNPSSAPASNVTLTDRWEGPGALAFGSANPPATASGNSASWNLGTIGAGQSVNVTVTMRGVALGTTTNEACVQAECVPPVCDTAVVEVKGTPAILVEVVDDPDPLYADTDGTPTPAEQTTYTISVTNQGFRNLTNIVIVCDIQSQGEATAVTPPVVGGAPLQYNLSGNQLTFSGLPVLEPDRTAIYKVMVWAKQPGPGTQGDTRFNVQVNCTEVPNVIKEEESTHFVAGN